MIATDGFKKIEEATREAFNTALKCSQFTIDWFEDRAQEIVETGNPRDELQLRDLADNLLYHAENVMQVMDKALPDFVVFTEYNERVKAIRATV